MPDFISLKDYVYDYISEEIGKGNLKKDEKINENSIIGTLGISRTPVREALIQLAAEGIIDSIPRKGFVIRGLTAQEALDIYKILGVLEGQAAHAACGNLTKKDFSEMTFYIESMDLAIRAENYDVYHQFQTKFHDIYLAAGKNETARQIIRQLKRKFLNHSYIPPENISKMDAVLETNEEHRVMFDLFQKEDAEGVENYVRTIHWDPVKAQMESLV
ncbi:MAG: GntR family transcriptional regulator [Clostridiales Family XIII bacterium]|jgi:DNA-binding GntR family transcriptional regulator|nr:GntR family transcriptional regulator [Clostridiales Family XIII bacterium]